MSLTARRCFALFAIISALVILLSCSFQPAGPKPGTPAFFWGAAKETFAAGDYSKTLDHLDNLLTTENEYTARALPWYLVLSSGTANGYIEMDKAYDAGAHATRADPSSFRRQTVEYRKAGGQMALRFAEKYSGLGKLPGDSVALVFGYPRGSVGEVAQLSKVYMGMMPLAADIEAIQKRTIEKNVLQAACEAAGAPNDSAKAQALLSAPDAKVPLATFQLAMAGALHKSAELYSRDKLDDPRKMENLCQMAQGALKGVPDSKTVKELTTKIQNTLKKAKKS
jgi:hypothetical protein